MSWRTILTSTLLSSALLAGCGGGGGGGGGSDDGGGGGSPTADASTSSYSIDLPDGVTTSSLGGDFDGTMVFAGQDATASSVELGGMPVARSYTGMVSGVTLTSRDVAGFVAERPAPEDGFGFQATSASQSVDVGVAKVAAVLNSTTPLKGFVPTDFQEISRQSLLSGAIDLGTFQLTTSSNVTPTEVASELVGLWGLNKEGGSVSNLPDPASDETTSTTFTIQTGVFFASVSQIYIAVAVVPTDLAGTYQALTGVATDPNNAVPSGATVSSKTDSFTGTGGGGVADFLFVVDNSGSMGNEQDNLANAASAFSNVLSGSGLDFQVGVMTTDSSDLVTAGTMDPFTDSTSEFETRVNGLGTGGSITESGIFHAEEGLLSGGSVDTAGVPRSGAQLSVIMVSDEPDQYTSYSSGGVDFDQSSNVFLSNNYIVHAIVDTSSSFSSPDYTELANNTGGSRAPIASSGGGDLTESDFTQIMTTIAQKAGGAASTFKLSETPVPSSITVTDEGSTVPRSSSDGWTYNSSANSIVFNGNAVPDGGDQIEVTYDYVSSGGLGSSGGSGGTGFAGTFSGSSTTSVVSGPCTSETDNGTITISDQGGGSFEITGIAGQTFSGTEISGSLVSNGSFSYPEDGGTTTVTSWSASLDGTGNVLTGFATWSWSDGSDSCSGTSDISGTRQ